MLGNAAKALTRQRTLLVHWQLISGIAYDGLHSQVALAERVSLDPASTSRALSQLEDAGLVRRERNHEDRRQVSVNLTPAGRRWYARVRLDVMSELEPVFSNLTQAEARQLEALLLKLTPVPARYSS